MTRQQLWARGALARVERIKQGVSGISEGEYRTHCLKLPVLIKQCGLVQALAFLWSRETDESPGAARTLCEDLAQVYADMQGCALLHRAQNEADLMGYLALTRDLIEVAIWFRRFAQSELKNQGAA